jgi:predicted PurR-regulated permease PerM
MPDLGTSTPARRALGEPAWLRSYTLWVFGLVVTLLVGRWLVERLLGFLVTVLLSLFLGFAIEPIVDRLARRGWRRSLATLMVYLVLGVVAAAFIALVGSLVVNQTSGLVTSAPDGLAQISTWLKDHYGVNLPTTSGQITKKLSDYAPVLAGGALGFATSLLGLVFQLFTVALLGFYFATDGPRVRRALCSALPPARQLEVLRVWDLAIEKTAGFLYSRVLLAACSSAAHGTFFAIIGLPYALTLAIFVGVVSQFIPTVGTYIAGALPVLVALTVSPQKALLVLLFIIAYQQVENYLISPPLSAHTLELHPAIAFAGVIIGASLFGAAGAFLALPLVATGQAFFSSIITRHDLVESEMFDDVPAASDGADAAAVDAEVETEMHGNHATEDVNPD